MPPSATTTLATASAPLSTSSAALPPNLAAQTKRISKTHLPLFLSAAKTTTYADKLRPSIRVIAWSPLGTLIATGTYGGTVTVWNPEKGEDSNVDLKSAGVLSASSDASAAPALVGSSTSGAGHRSAQGKSATAQQSGGWGHKFQVTGLAFNPGKEAELASLATDGVLRIWDVRARRLAGELKVSGEGLGLCWRPDGAEVIVGTKNDTIIPVDLRTLTAVGSYKQNVQTNQIAFSWSGRDLLLTTGDGTVQMLDYPSMQLYHTINAHTSSCTCIQMCPRGRYIAIGGSDALISLWDTTDLVCQRTLMDMTGPVRSLSFSFDGSFIVGGSDEGKGLDIAHVETGEYVHKIETSVPTSHVSWHPSKYALAYAGETGSLKIVGAPLSGT